MPESAISIDDLLGLMPPEGRPWIHLGALAYEESFKSGVPIACPYADATEESEYWHLGFIGAQIVRDARQTQNAIDALNDFDFPGDDDDSHPH